MVVDVVIWSISLVDRIHNCIFLIELQLMVACLTQMCCSKQLRIVSDKRNSGSENVNLTFRWFMLAILLVLPSY